MKINLHFFDKHIFRELLGYTFFIFLSDIVDQLNSNVDKFLLGRLTGTIAVAIYSVGYNLKNYYTTVHGSYQRCLCQRLIDSDRGFK